MQFVKAMFDLHAEKAMPDARYRVYIHDSYKYRELLTERTWRWEDEHTYLQEMLQILAPAGLYKITLEKARPTKTKFTVKNMRVELGNAKIVDAIDQPNLEIL